MIQLYTFNDNWRLLYNREKHMVSAALKGHKISSIEHIGATSVVLCNTSGTIDVLVSIPSILDLFTIKNALSKVSGYECVEHKSNNHLLFFVRRNERKQIVATIRIVEYASAEYNKILSFKYYLKQKNSNVIRYNQFRQALAEHYQNDYRGYQKAKESYIQSILEEYCKY